jgi:hypothetical protein
VFADCPASESRRGLCRDLAGLAEDSAEEVSESEGLVMGAPMFRPSSCAEVASLSAAGAAAAAIAGPALMPRVPSHPEIAAQ